MPIKTIEKTGYTAAIILTIVGVYACLSRYLLPVSVHIWLSDILYGPEYTQRALPALASRPGIEIVHRVFGAAYLIIGLLQFNRGFRRKRPQLHKTLGKIFMIFSVTGALSGILFAALIPFAGTLEIFPVLAFALFMLYATYRAYIHIRRGEIAKHREWITRSYAVGLGIATIRLVFLAINLSVVVDQGDLLNTSLWAGWVLTVGAAEAYNQMLQAEQIQKKQRVKTVA